ncbi:MAG: hypothetical protein PF637_04515 [Spirochaetes bacterium]|jgi:hypothetical protein|nr:hypothetical protein [Spirochaetota bacterium]
MQLLIDKKQPAPNLSTVGLKSCPVSRYAPSPVAITDTVNTTASELAQTILWEIAEKNPSCSIDGVTDERFIDSCVMSHIDYFRKKHGIETDFLRIYILQTLILLKNAGIIQNRNCSYNIAEYTRTNLGVSLNDRLFDTFWNKSSWALLFPSMPSIAAHMQTHRSHIQSLFNSKKRNFYVDSVAIDYMLSTELNYRNELLFISFFDFSIIRWLSFFDCIRYTTDISSRISVTPVTTF